MFIPLNVTDYEATWHRLEHTLPSFCAQCESNCFVHAAEGTRVEVGR